MELVYLQVYELEDTSNEAASIVEQRNKTVDELSAQVEALQADEHRISNEYAELQRQHEEADAKQQQRIAKLNVAKDAVKKAKREADAEFSKVEDALKAISSLKTQLARLERERESHINSSNRRDRTRETASIQTALDVRKLFNFVFFLVVILIISFLCTLPTQNKRAKLLEQKDREVELKETPSTFVEKIAEAEEKLDTARRLEHEKKAEEGKLTAEINQLQSANRNRSVMFGSRAAEVRLGSITCTSA